MNAIEIEAHKLFQTVHGKGDGGSISEFMCLNPGEREGWMRLAKQLQRKPMSKNKSKSPLSDFIRLAVTLPDSVQTPGQRTLKKKHGTPMEFALACADAVGEISVSEAHLAVEKYRNEWNASK